MKADTSIAFRPCLACRRDLPLGDFTTDKKGFAGRASRCRACISAGLKLRRRNAAKASVTVEQKVCRTCRASLPADRFGRCNAQPDCLKPTCRDCRKAESRARYLAKSLEIRAHVKAWAIANRDKVRATKARNYERRKASIDKQACAAKLRSARQDLADWYVKSLLIQHDPALRRADIPHALVSAQRVHVQIKRLTKKENSHDHHH